MPTYTEADVVKPPRFNAYYDVEEVEPVDVSGWKLELLGSITEKASWIADQIHELPEQELIIRHICVEGWDYIGQWSGVNFRHFLRAGRRRSDRQIRRISAVRMAIPEASIWPRRYTPQTILATKYAREPITDPFGFPLRLRTATKLGFKNPKWITSIEVTNRYPGGYWEDRGFNWHSGI